MRALVLGSAAGGGFPQWNCLCPNCRLAWARDPRAKPRTQSSLALSADGRHWLLLNASPDLRQQIFDNPALHPRADSATSSRHSPITGVFVTNGDVDHLTGLLTLREQQAFSLFGSQATLDQLTGVFGVLNPTLVPRVAVALDDTVFFTAASRATQRPQAAGYAISAFAVPGKEPLYRERAQVEIGGENESTIGLEITWDRGRLFYIPGCARVTPALLKRIDGAQALFFDGTTFTDDEMISLGLSKKTAWRMGHTPMSGVDGSIAAFAPCAIQRKIFIHINNSNPVLRDDSPERAFVEGAGWAIGYDGMEIAL